ncbi:MAG: hypothetical protein Q8R10_05690 [Pseudomonas sp.]|uniref:DUF7482 domain-containing protein n=1 Tax=Pseudomonas sp. TaxID=306 RepID=UPI002735F68A|nr:hypothetical protein [Pseudomonas sp.]MDP3845901.1 hypothetical protein [Pseudomonas sp.]
MRRLFVLPLLGALLLGGCAGADLSRVELPLLPGWYDGQLVYYITTDISDAPMAAKMQANYVPRLANALPDAPGPFPLATFDRVYKFVDGSQPSVLPSIPLPLGAGNQDPAYSPLWHVYEVRWLRGPHTELRSADALLQAQEEGRVSVRPTGIIANCPVVRVGDQLLQRP